MINTTQNLHSTIFKLKQLEIATQKAILHHLHSTIFKLKQTEKHSNITKYINLHSTIFKLKLSNDSVSFAWLLFTFYYI